LHYRPGSFWFFPTAAFGRKLPIIPAAVHQLRARADTDDASLPAAAVRVARSGHLLNAWSWRRQRTLAAFAENPRVDYRNPALNAVIVRPRAGFCSPRDLDLTGTISRLPVIIVRSP
jgi:hypothetical protein